VLHRAASWPGNAGAVRARRAVDPDCLYPWERKRASCVNAGDDFSGDRWVAIPAVIFCRDAQKSRANLNRRIPVALTSHQPADDKRCRQPRPKKRGQHDANMHQIIS